MVLFYKHTNTYFLPQKMTTAPKLSRHPGLSNVKPLRWKPCGAATVEPDCGAKLRTARDISTLSKESPLAEKEKCAAQH